MDTRIKVFFFNPFSHATKAYSRAYSYHGRNTKVLRNFPPHKSITRSRYRSAYSRKVGGTSFRYPGGRQKASEMTEPSDFRHSSYVTRPLPPTIRLKKKITQDVFFAILCDPFLCLAFPICCFLVSLLFRKATWIFYVLSVSLSHSMRILLAFVFVRQSNAALVFPISPRKIWNHTPRFC